MGLAGLIAVVASGLGAVVVATVAKVIADDVKEWTPVFTVKLVDYAAALLPQHERERYCEEWVAHLQEIPGVVGRLVFVLGLFVAALFARERYAREQLQAWDSELRAIVGRMIVHMQDMNDELIWFKEHREMICSADHSVALRFANIDQCSKGLECETACLKQMGDLHLGLTFAGVQLTFRRKFPILRRCLCQVRQARAFDLGLQLARWLKR